VSLVVLEDVSLSFADRSILDQANLRLAQGDRIGLIGPNGSGKTTLLRIIAGQQACDGKVQLSGGVSIGYLPQDIAVVSGETLREFVLGSVPGRAGLDEALKEAEAELESSNGASEEELMELAERIADLHERIDHFERYFSEREAMRILAGLGFRTEDENRDMGEFSGGWKMRAVLAALLFQRPDLLLLDEPTNHLDMPSVAWFSDFLKRYKRAFILISHDREFLNEQIARVVSFEPEGLRHYTGNYELYVKNREEEEVILENKAKNLARERERMQRFVDRFRAQANKAAAVQSRVKALEKMEDVELYQKRRVMRFKFPPCERSVTEVARIEHVSKSYDDNEVFRDLNLVIRRGERIGIIGPNGAGKTTLLRMVAGELDFNAGDIKLGSNVKVGYYAQHHADTLHRGSTVYQEVMSANPDASPGRTRSILGAFLFSGDDVDKSVSVLSGGERARVALAKLLINPGNFLLMDEPSNHLDLQSAEALTDSLTTFDGTLVFVSHNRALVRSLATTIWNIEDGTVERYEGSLDEYMYSCRMRIEAEQGELVAEAATEAPVANEKDSGKRSREADKERKRREAALRNKRSKVLGPLKKRIDDLETRIGELEALQSERSQQLADPEVYADEKRRRTLLSDYQGGQEKLDELNGRWEALAEELDAAETTLAAEQESQS
jgi:ATP-binding cassette subfamily F protein 3